jgi:LuxR family quorum sensing-dependent transcriptional regulator
VSPRHITFQAIEDLNRAAAPDAVMTILQRVGGGIGYESFCVAGIPEPGETLAPYVMLSGWPGGWLERYTERDYIHVDPVITRLKTSTLPFEWRDAPYDHGRGSRPAAVMNEAQDFGLVEGISVPIYSVSGFQAAVSFGARRLRPSEEEKGALHLVAIYAHNRLREILAGSGNVAARKATALSAREAECLRWSAEGKTMWEVATILSLSERTVEGYLRTAACKLGAANRTHAVAQAIRAGILH